MATSHNGFNKCLNFGRVAEGMIAKWIMARGGAVMPAYELEIDGQYKGPQLFTENNSFASPDLLVFNKDKAVVWIEAKRKTVFTWYRIKQQWETGIDLRHWNEYQDVADATGAPVWILFMHEQSVPQECDAKYNCPPECPTGLFGNEMDVLKNKISHTSMKHGFSGMVYWAHRDLIALATLSEMQSFE